MITKTKIKYTLPTVYIPYIVWQSLSTADQIKISQMGGDLLDEMPDYDCAHSNGYYLRDLWAGFK